eukprot:8636396-Alexandrium_andersonii.AAC.1
MRRNPVKSKGQAPPSVTVAARVLRRTFAQGCPSWPSPCAAGRQTLSAPQPAPPPFRPLRACCSVAVACLVARRRPLIRPRP